MSSDMAIERVIHGGLECEGAGVAALRQTLVADLAPLRFDRVQFRASGRQEEADAGGLELIGLTTAAIDVKRQWDGLLGTTGVKPTPMYRRACRPELRERAAISALEGTKKIGCRIVQQGTTGPIHDLLNAACEKFWTAPGEYHAWEREAIARLR